MYKPETFATSYMRFKAVNINGKTTGNTLLGKTATNRGRFLVTGIRVIPSAVSGLTLQPTISVGWTATAYSDLVSLALLGAPTIGVALIISLSSNKLVPANTDLYLRISTAAIGTTYTFDAIVQGYYI